MRARETTESSTVSLLTCAGSSLVVLGHGQCELCSPRQNKRRSATNHHNFHSKNTIKGCVLTGWAWEPFPPALLQHESLGDREALHVDARPKMLEEQREEGELLRGTVELIKSYAEEDDEHNM